jgi:branched-chain amino acid transport system ATP-binding protein
MSALLAARGVRAGYRKAVVLHDLDLEVSAGEFVVLAGPNGAGKTTTCLALAGQLGLMGGSVLVRGRPVTEPVHKRVRHGLGLLPERRAVFNALTVRQNIRLGPSSTDQVLAIFPELEKRIDVKAGLLSGGEQQMLAVGRVLAAHPEIIIVDELSFGLAPIIVRRLLSALRAAVDDGAGVLLVEQHVHVALEYADRAYFLKRGTIEFAGTAEEARSNRDVIAELYVGSVAGPEHGD